MSSNVMIVNYLRLLRHLTFRILKCTGKSAKRSENNTPLDEALSTKLISNPLFCVP